MTHMTRPMPSTMKKKSASSASSDLVTVAEAARILGVSRPTINAMALREQIKTQKVVDRWYVVKSSLPQP